MMRKLFPSELVDRFMVRLPDGMRDQLTTVAKLNRRTINAEIVARLARSFEKEMGEIGASGLRPHAGQETIAEVQSRLDNLERKIADLQVPDFTQSELVRQLGEMSAQAMTYEGRLHALELKAKRKP